MLLRPVFVLRMLRKPRPVFAARLVFATIFCGNVVVSPGSRPSFECFLKETGAATGSVGRADS